MVSGNGGAGRALEGGASEEQDVVGVHKGDGDESESEDVEEEGETGAEDADDVCMVGVKLAVGFWSGVDRWVWVWLGGQLSMSNGSSVSCVSTKG